MSQNASLLHRAAGPNRMLAACQPERGQAGQLLLGVTKECWQLHVVRNFKGPAAIRSDFTWTAPHTIGLRACSRS